MRMKYQAPIGEVTSDSRTFMEAWLRGDLTTTENAEEPVQHVPIVEEENVNRAIIKDVKKTPEVVSDDRHRTAKLAFNPRSGRDVKIELGLLEILSDIGKESLDELSYEDYVRMVQIVKKERLLRVEVKLHWVPIELIPYDE